MATKLILIDDILVEAEVPANRAREIAGDAVDQVDQRLDAIQPLLLKICRPLYDTWKELHKDMSVDQAEVELGLSFTGEGNLYVTKATAAASIKVKLVLKPLTSE